MAVRLDDLAYDLPEDRIAQAPVCPRDAARLLVVPPDGSLVGHRVRDLPELLRGSPPCLFVVNDTKVLPSRIDARRATSGRVELLFVEPLAPTGSGFRWLAMAKRSKGLAEGAVLTLPSGQTVTVVARRDDGNLELEGDFDVLTVLAADGRVPLPPYVRRAPNAADQDDYQTRFAAEPGAVAAPTAGLHFTDELVARLEAEGHRFAQVTLHVGLGTFLPVKTDTLEAHTMHEERYVVSGATAAAIDVARREGRPVVAIGTTVVRTLESAACGDGRVAVGAARTRLLIQPPYSFRVVDGLLTNFHLPRSTLLALVMAFAGEARTREAYAHAVADHYRFFSYGDAMWLPPRPR